MSTPNQLSDTPRTDAAWAKTFQDDEDQCRAGNAATDMRDECATLERELAALAAERDQLRAALALGQQNCDDAYDDLRAERAAAIARMHEGSPMAESTPERTRIGFSLAHPTPAGAA